MTGQLTVPKIYYYNFTDDAHTLDELKEQLGAARFAYCSNMKSEAAALNSAYAFLLLRYALLKEYGISDIPVFEFNDHGKPFLKDFPDIYFSMSHCKRRAVCAVSDIPVGADIQDIRKLDLRAAKKFLTPLELEKVTLITDKSELSRELCRLWCIKESHSKMTGIGFGEGFCGYAADELISSGKASVAEKDGCFISVCIGQYGEDHGRENIS